MNYFLQSLWILVWPVLIMVCYLVIKWILKNYEHRLEEEEKS